ncbi:hypothetical protein RQP46_007716 [Phenoliferia psychrophenolica]
MPLSPLPTVDAFIDAVLQPVPPDSNPSLALLDALRSFFARPPSSVTSQLIALSIIFALLEVLIIISLVRKVRGGEFWVFRILVTSRGSYLHPHLGISWQLCTVVFLAGIQAYLWGVYALLVGRDNPFLTAYGPLAWYASWLSGWLAMWALSVSKASLLRDPRGLRHLLSTPYFLNTFFVLVPLVTFFTITLACSFSMFYWSRIKTGLSETESILAELAERWDPNASRTTVLVQIRETIGPALRGAFDGTERLSWWFSFTWIVWFWASLFLYLIISIVGFLHLRYIRDHLFAPLVAHSRDTSNDRHREIRCSLYALSLAVFCIGGIGLSFTTLAGVLGFGRDSIENLNDNLRLRTLLGL